MNLTKRVLAIVMVLAMLLPTMAAMSFAADTVTIFYNPNGGNGGPGKITATVGETVTVPSSTPLLMGMTFRGWATSAQNAANGIIAYTSGSTFKVTANTTLYAAFAYNVVLKCGNEGAGTASKILYKFPGRVLELAHDKASVTANYGMYPNNNDQRSFIQWNTAQDSTTSKGTGTAYWDCYTENKPVTLYAIWGYAIQYNGDGGIFPKNNHTLWKTYVCDCDDNDYQNPKTLYGNFDFPEGDNLPTKEGCRLYTNGDQVFYGLLYADMSFFTTESAQQNLTIPPTGGKMPWSVFHCSTTDDGNACPEFYAIWEPSVTYKANGGSGSDIVEWITWDWGPLHSYNSYTVRSNSFSKSGASFKGWNTMPDGSGVSYSAGTTINHNSSDPIVLYAQWSDGTHGTHYKASTVSFDANGGTGAPAAQTKYWGSVLNLSTEIPTKAGYQFLGWGGSKFDTTVYYKPGDPYGTDANVRLYAVWGPCSHSYSKTSSTTSTCTKQGVATYTCSICQSTYTEGLDYSHMWSNWTSNGDGTDTRTCIGCGATETRASLCNHTYDNGNVTKASTCMATGIKTYTCTLCGETKTETIAKLEHVFTNYVSNNNETCLHGATFTAYCDYGCGTPDTYLDSSTQLDHVFTNYVFDNNATCLNGGTQTASCDYGCGKTDTIVYDGPTVDHKFTNYVSNGDATCGTDGTKTAYCDYGCGATDTLSDAGSATGNHLFYDYISNNDATCTEEGTMTAFCEHGCGVTDTIKDMGSKLDHIFTTYVSDHNPTCTSNSTMTAYCDYGCGTTDSKFEEGTQLDHIFTVYVSNDDATCYADGTKSAYCDYGCGHTDTVADEGTITVHKYTIYTSNGDAKCTEDGTETAYCDYGCGNTDTRTDADSALGHSFGEWIVTTAPTTTTDGEETRYCTVCGAFETRVVLKLGAPRVSVDNYVITITNADLIKDIRFASGTYTTGSEVKAAEGNVALSNSIVVKNTSDGIFTYEMPYSGYFTLWVRMTDGEEYFLYADVTNFTPYLSSYGVKITVHNLNNVKDFFIAKGEYTTYSEIKTNGYIFNATASKIAGKHNYTHTVYEPGVHTVLIRYNDGTFVALHETLVVDEPVFKTTGLQVIISNLPDVRVIRTAYGEWNTTKELKATDTIRNFSAKTAIKGKDPYTIQYREEGRVTVIVEYNNGYVKVFHYDVKKNVPTVSQSANTVTFGNLDNLHMIRFAKGVYSTASEIKAAGAVTFKPDSIVNGTITATQLEYETTYTFLVQYTDESYNYYVITIEPARPEGSYIMTLDPNGGTMPAGYETRYYFYLNEKFVDVIGGYPVPTRPGYTFYAWERVDYPQDHTWSDSWGSQPYTFEHDVTLRAIWIPN